MALFHQLAQTLTVSPKPLATRTSSVLYKGLFGNTPVAVKVLTNHNSNEINVQHELQPHPNILSMLASTKRISDGSPALIYPYIEQGSLESYFRAFRMDQTPLHERLQLLVQITDALVHLEFANILHCDLKASNILLQFSSNDKPVPMLNDFGESIVQQPQKPTNKLPIRGSPYHMAPELLQLKVQDRLHRHTSSSSSSTTAPVQHRCKHRHVFVWRFVLRAARNENTVLGHCRRIAWNHYPRGIVFKNHPRTISSHVFKGDGRRW